MKCWLLYAAAFIGIAALGASPFQGTDVAQLAPVEVVWLSERNGQVYLETDTEDVGRGTDAASALADMKAAAPGTVFLETADYLIVEKGREVLLTQVYDMFRPSCKVCIAESMPNLEKAAAFFAAHEPQTTLRRQQIEKIDLPLLTEQKGRFLWDAE